VTEGFFACSAGHSDRPLAILARRPAGGSCRLKSTTLVRKRTLSVAIHRIQDGNTNLASESDVDGNISESLKRPVNAYVRWLERDYCSLLHFVLVPELDASRDCGTVGQSVEI
jgi:hypothetical protein